MKLQILGICIATVAFSPICSAEEKQQERPDWAHFFKEASAEGTIVVADERTDGGSTGIYDEARASKRYSPASTFKIPHTLFALDAGVVRDEFQVFPWDGTKRWLDTWNHDQNLRSAMRNSVVWVYQKFAREIGDEREGLYLRKINYGNTDPSGADPFWVEGNLGIFSAGADHVSSPSLPKRVALSGRAPTFAQGYHARGSGPRLDSASQDRLERDSRLVGWVGRVADWAGLLRSEY
jgi:beta-lactamase class D